MLFFSMLLGASAERLAVLDFESKLKGDLPEILADQVRAGALDTLDPIEWSIITRENMVQILTDMGKDATCIDGSCEVELARNIGADYVISGTVSQVDSLTVLSMKLHDSATGKLVSMETVQSDEAVDLVGKTFAQTEDLLVKGLGLALESSSVWLTVTTKPSARLYWDDRLLCAETPCRREVDIGQHTMRLESEQYASLIETISIEDSVDIVRNLERTKSQLTVQGVDKNVMVYLDQKPLGKLPVWTEISAGQHEISVEDPCFQGKTVSFSVAEGESKDVWMTTLPQLTTLQLSVRDRSGRSRNAEIYADHQLVGSSNTIVNVPVCTEGFVVSTADMKWEGAIALEPNQRNKREIELRKNGEQPPSESDYQMIAIEGGRFWMGSPNYEKDRNRDEEQHQVHLTHDFYIGQQEVPQWLWQSIMGNNPSSNRSCGGNCPVDSVSWCDAIIFANRFSKKEGLEKAYRLPHNFMPNMDTQSCNTLAASVYPDLSANGYRLPTEAEWEYVARDIAFHQKKYDGVIEATDRFSGSDRPQAVAWFAANSRNETHNSCEKQKNALEICDMTGNVFEWVGDWYEEDTSLFSNVNPIGPTMGQTKVLRGGSYQSNSNVLRNAFRYSNEPGFRSAQIGFRLVRGK